MAMSDEREIKPAQLDEALERVKERTGVKFSALRDWDLHRYDFGTLNDENNSVSFYKKKLEQPGSRTVDDTVYLYVLKAFNAISAPSKFREYAEKAVTLLNETVTALDTAKSNSI